jgi:hypothetical protein
MTIKSRSVILAVILLLLSFGLAIWILPQLPLRQGAHPRAQTIPAYPSQGEDAFFISAGSEELSHLALYHDIGESIANARKADILFFGNSRQQTGLREAVIAHEAGRLGLRAFTIATGHADKTRFALELIRRHDLRPKIVVASGGYFVFTEGTSPWAREVMAMSHWEAVKAFWERRASWAFRSRLHRQLPRLDFFEQPLYRGWVDYRSETSGWWRHAIEPAGHFPVSMKKERRSYRLTLPLARELKRELDHRGSLLVLTMVPFRNTQTGHLPYLSEKLGVPYILPSFEGLETADGSHLNYDSAMRISRQFWTEFTALEEVRTRLGL